uniref:Uncharacterized protein n=1 Tax=Florenciella parvula TaxID=236787 RepID=A0A7S2B9W3_9STRA
MGYRVREDGTKVPAWSREVNDVKAKSGGGAAAGGGGGGGGGRRFDDPGGGNPPHLKQGGRSPKPNFMSPTYSSSTHEEGKSPPKQDQQSTRMRTHVQQGYGF